jgi:hypothetical protein
MSLGETIKTHVILSNTSSEPVVGVKMMIEVQGPNGRYRLGELANRQVSSSGMDVDGEEEQGEPELEVDGEVGLDVDSEMKDVGLNILIISVAWETPEGRKTFQRFLKFNVSPLSTKGSGSLLVGNTSISNQDENTYACYTYISTGPDASVRSTPRGTCSEHVDDRTRVRESPS